MKFEPFDNEFIFDESLLTEEFPNYLMPGVKKWVFDTLSIHSLFSGRIGLGQVLDDFIHPLNRSLRKNIPSNDTQFWANISSNVILFRNVLSFMLQNVADINDARELEKILIEGSSAYSVEFIKGNEVRGIRTSKGETIFEHVSAKLTYRVAPIVKKQADETIRNERLLGQAWEFYYGLESDDEKTVVRSTDALSGLLRDQFFPDEKRPVLGTILNKISEDPSKYPFPANSIYETKDLIKLMKQFSKIRGNHQKGTGRMPTHEEAGFVLHLTITIFQLFKNNSAK